MSKPAPELRCSNCGRPEREQSGVVQECSCGCRMFKAVKPQYRPPVNMTERARRAEMVAANNAASLERILHLTGGNWISRPTLAEWRTEAQAALDAWEAHKADLATLEGRDG